MSEHLTNIVVVALVHDSNGRIFIARRADTKATFSGQFEIIGGHLDPGEALEAGLKREIKEEIGCDIDVEQLIDAFTYHSEDTFKVELVYLCRLKSGQVPTLHPDDHSESRWIGAGEIDVFEKDDEETAALRKAFKIIQAKK